MAIRKRLEVTVEINDQKLHEYEDQHDAENDANSSSGYIESTSGAAFSVRFHILKNFEFEYNALEVHIDLDGVHAVTVIFPKDKTDLHTFAFRGAPVDHAGWHGIRKFAFSEVHVEETSISTTHSPKSSRHSNLGTIVVRILRSQTIGSEHKSQVVDSLPDLHDASHVSEKELKGKSITHVAKLGAYESLSKPTAIFATHLDNLDNPFATFTFKYCSRRALQGLLLIPRTPSPPPAQALIPLEERPIETLTMAEKEELVRRQQARYRAEREQESKAENGIKAEPRIKRERDEGERDEEYEQLMSTAVTKKSKTRPFEQGEVVELD